MDVVVLVVAATESTLREKDNKFNTVEVQLSQYTGLRLTDKHAGSRQDIR